MEQANSKIFESKNSLPEDVRRQAIQQLDGVLASTIDLWTHSKQAHWNLKGMQFVGLHRLFDKLSEEVQEYIDHVAERITMLGGQADGTIANVSQKTDLPSYSLSFTSAQEHVDAISSSLATYGNRVRQSILKLEDLQDPATSDMLTDILRSVDKYLWFVEAHMQGRDISAELEQAPQEPRAIPGVRAGATLGNTSQDQRVASTGEDKAKVRSA